MQLINLIACPATLQTPASCGGGRALAAPRRAQTPGKLDAEDLGNEGAVVLSNASAALVCLSARMRNTYTSFCHSWYLFPRTRATRCAAPSSTRLGCGTGGGAGGKGRAAGLYSLDKHMSNTREQLPKDVSVVTQHSHPTDVCSSSLSSFPVRWTFQDSLRLLNTTSF